MSGPDLFVVCKNCGSEVSPYVTECPYCGQRVRKRAPRIDREPPEEQRESRPARRRGFGGLGSDRIEGIAPDARPVATMCVVGLCLLITLVLATGAVTDSDLGSLTMGLAEQPWRFLTTTFVHTSLGYEFVSLGALAIFGTLIERRFGALGMLLVVLAAGTAGAAAAAFADVGPLFEQEPVYLVQGSNGAALGLLAAWLMDDRLAARSGADRDNDLTGVYVIAVVLALLPLAVTEASVVTGLVGAAAGALLGFPLRLFDRT